MGTRTQPVAPFPGPGTGSSNEQVDQAGGGDGILSPTTSVFSSQSSTNSLLGDHEHDMSHDKSHDTNIIHEYDVEIEITGVEDKEQGVVSSRESSYEDGENVDVSGNANDQLLNGVKTRSELRVETDQKREGKEDGGEEGKDRVSSPQDVAKIEAFHNNLAYHFSTILLSENATEVVSSAQ